MRKINGIIMQYFEWYMESKQNLWKELKEKAEELSKIGITAVWMPPAYKGVGGKEEVGYGAYDLYDLGEFDQKGTIKTKYGSKDEYIEAIIALKQAGIESYADIVLNHKMGADEIQTIPATKVEWFDHNKETEDKETVQVATKFTFPGRKHKYSDFEWNWNDFDGIDYNNKTGENAIFKFKDKQWGVNVDEEFGNFDYLMGADLDFSNPRVVKECQDWAKWYLEMTKVDGFRLDAVKHIDANFYKDWIQTLRKETKKALFTVGEYWSTDVSKLHKYIQLTEGKIALFDVPLHYNFYNASKDDKYNMSQILEHTLVKENPCMAVTFVDNHDTQPGQALQSFVEPWFKPIAYSIILLRNEGYPCVFYGDYYGIPYDNIEPSQTYLKNLMFVRKERAYGIEHDYFDNNNYIGWTLEGDIEHSKSGIAVVISNAGEGIKRMYVGKQNVGEKYIDIMGKSDEKIIIDEEGCGNFEVKERSVSVWIKS